MSESKNNISIKDNKNIKDINNTKYFYQLKKSLI